MKEADSFSPAGRAEWREWLVTNHQLKEAVWLIYHKKASGKSTLTWSEAVDEALCFGWIDSRANAIDELTYKQFFCRRKPGSGWSKINKEKVRQLAGKGLMMAAGWEAIEIAKRNGAWTLLDSIEELTIPKDLRLAFKAYKGSKIYFESLSNSVKKAMLQWVTFAKRTETRQKRIEEIASLAARKEKPKPF